MNHDGVVSHAGTPEGSLSAASAIGRCVAAVPATLEPLKALSFYRAYPAAGLCNQLVKRGEENVALRKRQVQLLADIDEVLAEAKESKRKYPYPKKRR